MIDIVRVGFLTTALLIVSFCGSAMVSADAKTKIVNPLPVMVLSGYSGSQKFNAPSGLFVDKKRGEVWVADTGNHQIVEFDAQGNPSFRFRYMSVDMETGEAVPGAPLSVAVDSAGEVFVTDGASRKVSMYDYRGRLQKRIDLPKITGLDSVLPGFLKVDGDDNLYIGDTVGMRLIVLDRDQQLVRVVQLKRSVVAVSTAQSNGQDAQQSNERISAMDIGSDGRIYLVNSEDYPCVRVLDATGKELIAFGDIDSGWDNFRKPYGIVGIDDGTFWVADAGIHIVKQFAADGKYQQYIGGGPGSRPGEMRLPSAMATDGKGRLYVAERGTNRVQSFSLK